jgi:uncharacterized protein YoxC
MPTTLTPPSVDQTDQLAQNLPGLAAEPAIAAVEQGLLDFLSTPPPQILGGLPLQQLPGQPPADPEAPADPGLANQIDPFQLISSLLGGLGTLGSGQFPGVDPTQILGGVSEAIDAITPSMQQARGSVAHDWQGVSGAAADEKARLAVGKGADVATRADALRDNVSTAASNVAQARRRMIDIANEYQAKMAAIDLSTPAGRAAAVTAANEATEESTAVMQELQATLGLQAQQVSAIAEPLQVTNAPGVDGATTGGPLSPLMGLARLDPTGVLPTIIGDPRLTPQGLAGNFMDLLFAPQTLTDMNQTLKQTNSTIGNTNTIMTGLGGTLDMTNGTLRDVNGTMHTLDGTMHTVNGTMQNGVIPAMRDATGAMYTVNGTMQNGVIPAMRDATGAMYTVNGTMQNVDGTMQNVDGTLQGVDGTMQNVDGTMQGLDGRLQGVDGTMGEVEEELETTNGYVEDGKEAAGDAADAVEDTWDDIQDGNIGGGDDTPYAPW